MAPAGVVSGTGVRLRRYAGFGAEDRLHRSAEFLRLQRRGTRVQSEHFVVYAGKLDDRAARPRLGITVSRRIGAAAARNRVKRRVRECFRLAIRRLVPPGAAIVVIARPGAAALASGAIRNELTEAAQTVRARLGTASK